MTDISQLDGIVGSCLTGLFYSYHRESWVTLKTDYTATLVLAAERSFQPIVVCTRGNKGALFSSGIDRRREMRLIKDLELGRLVCFPSDPDVITPVVDQNLRHKMIESVCSRMKNDLYVTSFRIEDGCSLHIFAQRNSLIGHYYADDFSRIDLHCRKDRKGIDPFAIPDSRNGCTYFE